MSQITPAEIDWSDPAAPLAANFGDFYFSKKDGIAETDYVFLQHNQLPQRWIQHQRDYFCVAETGFGTGLNLMVLWRHFRVFQQQYPKNRCQRLHFVSFEKHPLSETDLNRAHQQWPEFAEMAAQIRANYPLPIDGCHRMVLDDGKVIVDLWFGDVLAQLPKLSTGNNGIVDAWFLDGFTPSKNPDMWQPQLYQQMARLSRHDATVATFTAASAVRKGLIAEGFAMQKDQGFRGKREMIFGQRNSEGSTNAAPSPSQVAVVGAGIAAASTALSLVRRGIKVNLYCKDEQPAGGASGNRQGALYPLLNLANDGMSQFFQQGYVFARQALNQLSQNHHIDHQWCGVLQLAPNATITKRIEGLSHYPWPTELAHGVTAEQASHIADIDIQQPGLFYPYGGWLNPAQLTAAIIAQATKSGLLACHFQHQLNRLAQQRDGWQLQFANHKQTVTANSDAVVLAMGHHSVGFEQTKPLPLNPVRGQIAYPPEKPLTAPLKTVLCADGYLVPSLNGRLTCGASFGRGDDSCKWRSEDKIEIDARMDNSFGRYVWRTQLQQDDHGRASVRAAVRDHLPLVGPVLDWDLVDNNTPINDPPLQQGLFILAGLGSRGLCSAGLSAELLTSQMLDEPRPLAEDLQKLLAPGRFWLRKIAKGQPLPK
ncbi:bifunctional tRNA (5-methylaminomethyl-2-thiouridine)(34)-methyltransferase MnmD/FAD-dependent 5-carboxymethylaminomethyl-2-thiouridine(34) oxidoreductase MnmC [Ferrimonas lipolytica]|uniref:tRNA 5-methylaminomethyl-2-thiouridine biosynthesis bifunctional protein MnmC n=1 Tax=Ferrimonas lipolytica TaxID=2724191 RepID=A0A6H1UDR4_9GAMM|nr:bifunctional tRNA (5-methylaminomethyl-2-thiouridine)(34)-methyltransferase MnmD/FAD-dependent 5-carboxymethylaminomethyl-2-thiouridine(34) oxidoreductase MnmC [Ferrimonas lipolytica]QIZ77184.1 bifunctional tRNA (5-methylaminomethyl-2-thiouridine)(34)-methyltransferase MnmD/FAD-dependent 5-carboxymethylaminomethyl-2-thiouridine(34) oxidoreductase MnmC [Ferrimonas lipolytica]